MTVTETTQAETAESIREDAELVVDVCMSVESDDVVTIITDDDHIDQARVVADVCVDRGAWPVVMNNETQVRRGLADTLFPMAPPRNLHQAMVNSDEIIIITNLEWANRFAHVSAVKESCAANAKIASVEPGMGSWGLTEEALLRAQRRAWDAMAALEGVEKVRVTSAKGTDFTVTIKDRPALEVASIKKRGQMMGPLPLWAEVAFAAVEDETQGTMVVDGVMLGNRPARPGQGADHLDDRGRQGRRDRGRRGGPPAARSRRRRRQRDSDRRVRVRRQRGGTVRNALGEGSRRHRPLRVGRQPQRVPRRPERLSAAPRRSRPRGLDADRRQRPLDPEGRQMGAVDGAMVRTVALEDVEPIPLPGGSWSRMVLTDKSLSGNSSSLGYSVFTPGCVTAMVSHETEEVAFVLSGSGELRLDGERVPFAARQGLFVPARTWHAVANTGTEDVIMVFGFPHPDYPPTERKETQA